MQDYETEEKNSSVDKRDIRAATESMVVTNEAPGLARVYSGETPNEYIVGIRAKVCNCPAFQYQSGKCKHIRRVEMEIGDRPIPDLPGTTDVEGMIKASHDKPELVTDGGVATHNDSRQEQRQEKAKTPGYTTHIEPPEQGGKKYDRCKGCGRELLAELGGRSNIPHKKGCANPDAKKRAL